MSDPKDSLRIRVVRCELWREGNLDQSNDLCHHTEMKALNRRQMVIRHELWPGCIVIIVSQHATEINEEQLLECAVDTGHIKSEAQQG